MNLFLLFLFACDNSYEAIEKHPEVVNKYDSSKPTTVDLINPTYGVIDETFILEGNFPGDIADMKVYFGTKKAVLIATDGKSITGLVPKQPNGYNQVSLVIGTDSMAPTDLKFKYHQSRSMKTICGKLGTEAWMADANYAGTALDGVTLGECHYVETVAGTKADNIVLVETGWGNRLFMLSIDDSKITKLSTPTQICKPAVPSTRDRFYATNFNSGNRPIYLYTKENSWTYVNTGITLSSTDFPDSKVDAMTFAEDDNLLYALGTDGRIAEINISDKSYKIYTTAAKKPSGINANNFGGLITGTVLPSNFGSWEDAYICYSKYHKCFFVTYTNEHAVYKYEKNADNTWTCTLWAGKNGSGVTVGNRLADAQFYCPHGIVANPEGDLFVVSKGANYWTTGGYCRVHKISKDAVEIVAGSSNSTLTNGADPLEAVFKYARGIAIDIDGNFYIAGGNDFTVRKLSIE